MVETRSRFRVYSGLFLLFLGPALISCGSHVIPEQARPGVNPTATPRLGHIDFPTSATSPLAEKDFVDGVLALHGFNYGLARQKFQDAANVEPKFAMAYWGMALSHTYLLWGEEDFEAGKALLGLLAPTAAEREKLAPTEREKMYLRAVEELYSSPSRETRLQRFTDSLRGLVRKYPRDLEAKSFYALALLAIINPEEFGYEKRGIGRLDPVLSTLREVLSVAPNHPGALHYLIHALDAPGLAKDAEPYLVALEHVAPDLPHLEHMASHISLRLGRWEQSIALNEEAFYLFSHGTDFHALSYLHYSYLQMGPAPKYRKLADGALSELMIGMGKADPETDPGSYLDVVDAKVRQAFEWDDWDLIEDKLPPPLAYPQNWPWADEVEASHLEAVGVKALIDRKDRLFSDVKEALSKRKLAALARAEQSRSKPLQAEREENSVDLIAVIEHQLNARKASLEGNDREMEREMDAAVSLEELLGPPPARLPFPMQPSHELFAQLLLNTGVSASEVAHHLLESEIMAPNRWRTRVLWGRL